MASSRAIAPGNKYIARLYKRDSLKDSCLGQLAGDGQLSGWGGILL